MMTSVNVDIDLEPIVDDLCTSDIIELLQYLAGQVSADLEDLIQWNVITEDDVIEYALDHLDCVEEE